VLACTLPLQGGVCKGQQLAITNIVATSEGISLAWTSPTERYIVAQTTDLSTDQFQYVGNVLSTNCSWLTNDSASAFYRIRTVKVVDFPDPALRTIVAGSLPVQHAPLDRLYDIDVESILFLSTDGAGITNATGLGALKNLYLFGCQGNPLVTLDLAACTNLGYLFCNGSDLQNILLPEHGWLGNMECDGNQLTNLNLTVPKDRPIVLRWEPTGNAHRGWLHPVEESRLFSEPVDQPGPGRV